MSEYNIPTDGDIRSAYDAMCQLASAVGDFLSTLTRCSDRWLAEHDREVAAKTLIDAAQDIYIPSDGPSTIWALGEIWWAESTGGFFNQRWLVTRDGLEEANYEFVDN